MLAELRTVSISEWQFYNAYTEVFKYTFLKEIFQNTNTCYIEKSVISVNGGYTHSALHVQKCLGMLVIKIFLRNYLLLL